MTSSLDWEPLRGGGHRPVHMGTHLLLTVASEVGAPRALFPHDLGT